MQEFLIPFVAIGLAELLDKSQLSLLLLATRVKKPLLLLLGAILGFLVVDGLAVIIGSWITMVIPQYILKLTASGLFIVFGILAIRSHHEKVEPKTSIKNPLIMSFLTILLVEWGDKTQLATATFATQYNPLLVLAGVLSALLLLSGIAIFVGNTLSEKVDRRKIHLVSGIVFILIGIFFLIS